MTAAGGNGTAGGSRLLSLDGLDALLAALRADGYKLLGPRVRDGAIVHDDISGVADLPAGWGEEQEAGRYRLVRRDDQRLFGFSVGPQSWKPSFFAPRVRLTRLRRKNESFEADPVAPDAPRVALIGARACDLAAIAVQDRTFVAGPLREPDYVARRRDVFVVGVNCGQAGGTCFCVSMNTGPRVTQGHDSGPHRARRPAPLRRRGGERPGPRASRSAGRGRRGRWRSRRHRRDLRGDRPIDGPHPGHRRDQGAALSQSGASALGRRGGALSRLHQLHDGLPDLLLQHRRGRQRSGRPDGGALAALGLVLHDGALARPRRQRPGVDQGPLSPVADAQAGKLDRSVRHFGLRRLRALHHLVSGRHRHHRGGGGDPRRRSRRGASS